MTPPRNLLYFGHVPQEGAGSSIIVWRHLRRFSAEGWRVFVVADWGQDPALCDRAGWPVFELSHRRAWWPPFDADHPILRRIRGWLWAGEIRARIGEAPVTAVLTYLSAFSDTLSIAACGFARRYGVPLVSLVHDDCRCFAANPGLAERAHRRRAWVLRHSTGCFASPELAACYSLPPDRAAILPPIPAGCTPRQAGAVRAEKEPLLIYAGNYWPAQLEMFAQIGRTARNAGGKFLTVLKATPEHGAWLAERGVEWRVPFPGNDEALDYFRENTDALVVSYSATSDGMPWTRSSFPSKLIEYCHLGIPIAIVAPEDTALMHWARRNQFPDAFLPADTQGLANFVGRLRDPDFCRSRGEITLALARSEFDPATIHQHLTNTLLATRL